MAALIAALGTAGCGRKGPLDPPPAALTDNPTSGGTGQPVVQRSSLGEGGDSLIATPLEQVTRPRTQAAAPPPPPPKSFLLDFLIK